MDGASYLVMRDQKHCPQNRRSFSMIIARSIVGRALGAQPNVASRHPHRGQVRIPEPMRLEDAVMIAVAYKASLKQSVGRCHVEIFVRADAVQRLHQAT